MELDLAKLDIPTLRAMQQFVFNALGIIWNKSAVIQSANVEYSGTGQIHPKKTNSRAVVHSSEIAVASLIPDCARVENIMDAASEDSDDDHVFKSVSAPSSMETFNADKVNAEAWNSLLDVSAEPIEQVAQTSESSVLWAEAQRSVQILEEHRTEQRIGIISC